MDIVQHSPDSVSGQLRRRRQASQRIPRMACGRADPLTCLCDEDKPLSPSYIRGADRATRHLLDCGLLPAFSPATMRAMWRAGHRQLVEEAISR
jgi:hypothetical protein